MLDEMDQGRPANPPPPKVSTDTGVRTGLTSAFVQRQFGIGRLPIAPTLAMIFAALVTAASLIIGASLIPSSLAVAKNATELRLRDASRLLAAEIDADELALLKKPEHLATSRYNKIHLLLRKRLDKIEGVRYIYTLRLLPGLSKEKRPRFGFIVDGLPLSDKDFETVGNEMATSGSTDALLRVWKSGTFEVDRDFVTDKWGTWLSGYTPLRRRDGSFEAVLGIDIAARDVTRAKDRYIRMLTGGYLLSLLLIVPAAAYLGRRISLPLQDINGRLLNIARLDFHRSTGVPAKALWVKEIYEISESLSTVEGALVNFNRYVPSKLVRKLVVDNTQIELDGELRHLAIMFTDIIGFVGMTEHLAPAEVLNYLNQYFSVIHQVSEDTDGVLDKYMGDSAMLFWGAPDHVASPALSCVEAALLCQQRLKALNDRWATEGLSLRFPTAIGIDFGEVVVGNIGSSQRVNYTIVGDRVNLARRLEDVNRRYGTKLLATRAIIDALGDAVSRYLVVKIDQTRLRGFSEPIELFEIRGDSASASPEETGFTATYNAAYSAHERGDDPAALATLAEIREPYRNLPFVRLLEERCSRPGKDPEPDPDQYQSPYYMKKG